MSVEPGRRVGKLPPEGSGPAAVDDAVVAARQVEAHVQVRDVTAGRCPAHPLVALPCWRCAAAAEADERRHRAWLESEVRRAIGGLVPAAAGAWAYARQELGRELAAHVERDPGFAQEGLALLAGLPPLGYPADQPAARPGGLGGAGTGCPGEGRGRAAWEAELAGVVEVLVGMLEAAERRGRIGAAAEERARVAANMRAHKVGERTIERLLGVERESVAAAAEMRAMVGR